MNQVLFAAGDPLYDHGVNWAVILIVALKVLVAFAGLMGCVTLMIWFERKLISGMQSRIGPQRWGPFGLLQTLADGIKLFFKEDLVPAQADRARVQIGAVSRPGAGADYVLDRARRWHGDRGRAHLHLAGGRPADWRPAAARDVGYLGLRRDAGRMVVRFEVSAHLLRTR
jgi:hypothetical protein